MNDDLTEFQKQSLEFLNIPTSRLIKVKKRTHVRCKHLLVPTRLLNNQFVHPDGVHWLRQTFNPKIGKDHDDTRKCIFVSRQDAARRQLLNEGELVDALAPLGFQVVVPGQLPFEKQISTFANARLIVGPHGAGLTNMIFAPSDVQVIQLQNKSTRARLWSQRRRGHLMLVSSLSG